MSAEGISKNGKFGLKDQVVTIFPTIAPSCYNSMVHIQHKKLFPGLRWPRLREASEAYARDKGRVEAFPHHGEEGEKQKFGGLPAATYSKMDF